MSRFYYNRSLSAQTHAVVYCGWYSAGVSAVFNGLVYRFAYEILRSISTSPLILVLAHFLKVIYILNNS